MILKLVVLLLCTAFICNVSFWEKSGHNAIKKKKKRSDSELLT